ncbi:MAG TPA: cysteine desulfurase [Candidatus Olsenella excrementavium]|uniref:Cysteine desulfurase n=1 Tax=Candidatus Olsenella excrementavium TaxID=2838709 RepID=A0A9D1ZAX2_9ACTN|nr:cysteine desulfurase [Candidatus Olsenella excrementavium]
MTQREVYLDYAAATPVDPEVAEAMLPYLTERFWNPSAPYAHAREVRDDVERARGTVARLIGARPDCLTFTAGATEANNLAFAAVEGHVVVDAIEHESVLACAGTHARRTVRVGSDGLVDPAVVARAIRPDTELVSVELANGEIGCVQPVREISRVVATERARRLEAGEDTPIFLHSDASQAAGVLSVNVATLGVDLLTLSAAKIYGPKQVGVLWASEDVRLRPLVYGGGQEGGVRSGTENVAGIVGLARALELACERRGDQSRRLAALRERLREGILARVPSAVVSGPRNPKRRLPGLLHVSFAGVEARRLVIALERAGVSAGTGSACAASRMRVSHVLEAIGMPRALAEGSLRLTLGRGITEEDVDYAAGAIADAVRAEMGRTGLDDAGMAALAGGWR